MWGVGFAHTPHIPLFPAGGCFFQQTHVRILNMNIPRILLVDDQREVSRMLRSSLELSGRNYIVVDVPSGEEALLELGRGPVDLLVTDLRLPGISGLELVEKVRQLNPDAHAILITGHPSEDARSQADDLGVVAFLQKPIGTSIFLEAVDQAFKLRGPAGSPIQVHVEAKPRIADHLDTVQRELGADATLLIDYRSNIIVQVGDLMDLDLQASLPSLMAAFSSGLKVSSLAGALLPGNLQYFDGDTYDLYLTNVGAFYALLFVFSGKQGMGQMGSVVHYGRRAAEDLMDILSALGEAAAVEYDQDEEQVPMVEWVERSSQSSAQAKEEGADSAEEEGQRPPQIDKDVEEQDLDIADKDIKREDAEQFWDEAISDSPVLKQSEGDFLTYEEARDKGLLTDQSDDEPSEGKG